VYSTDSLGVEHLWKLDLKAGSPVQVTSGAGESGASCAPAGDVIYYFGRISGNEAALFKMPVAGGTPVQLSDQVPVDSPYVSPDGKHLLFTAARKDGSRVYRTLSTATGKVESEYPVPSTNSTWAGVSWMPDNRSIAAPDARAGTTNLWALPVLGGGPEKQITHYTAGETTYAQYSPDGKWLVVARGPNTGNAVLFREGSK
jgi:Tol biopolymer transport system component